MDWTKSYTSTWRVFRVNRKTWADAELLAKVDSVSISRTADGSMLESGSMEASGEFVSDYYRIVMTADQGGERTRVDVATMLFDVSGGEANFGRTAHKIDGYSVLYPASTTAVVLGEYAPAGEDGARYAGDLLSKTINAPVEVEGSFTLNNHIVHELGSSVIDAVWSVLDAGNFVMQIDGRGVVHIRPKPTEPSLTINNANIGLLSNGISFTSDISEIPNRYIVIEDDLVTTVTNDSPESTISTVNRGYYVDVVDTSPTPVNGKTVAEYAIDNLKSLSVMKDERTYIREYAPDVYVYSLVRASINGLQGDLRVTSQSVTCGNGITVNERAEREVSLW